MSRKRQFVPAALLPGVFAMTAGCIAPSVAGEREAAIPFVLESGHIFVDAFVNGHGPYRFGFDTGASGMGRADAQLTADLSLPLIGRKANSDGINVRKADVAFVHSLRVGDLQKTDVSLLSRDYHQRHRPAEKRFKGIIGRAFFADRVITIDYPARTIRFSRDWLKQGMPGVVSYGPGFSIPVCFAHDCYPGKVDTGSSRSLVLPEALARKIADKDPVRLGTVSRTNSDAILYGIDFHRVVQLSGVASGAGKALFVKPSVSTINIGSGFLKDFVLSIDQRHHLLRISKPDEPDGNAGTNGCRMKGQG